MPSWLHATQRAWSRRHALCYAPIKTQESDHVSSLQTRRHHRSGHQRHRRGACRRRAFRQRGRLRRQPDRRWQHPFDHAGLAGTLHHQSRFRRHRGRGPALRLHPDAFDQWRHRLRLGRRTRGHRSRADPFQPDADRQLPGRQRRACRSEGALFAVDRRQRSAQHRSGQCAGTDDRGSERRGGAGEYPAGRGRALYRRVQSA